MEDFVAPLILHLGIGVVAGGIVGYAIKKVAKVFLVILGIVILALVYLYYKDIITLNSTGFVALVQNTISVPLPNVPSILTFLPFSMSFLAGLAVGAKKGQHIGR